MRGGLLYAFKAIQAVEPKHFQVIGTLLLVQIFMQEVMQPVREIAQLKAIGIVCQKRGIPAHGFAANRAIASIEGGEISSDIADIAEGSRSGGAMTYEREYL